MKIIPGMQLSSIISAHLATTSEKILRYMAETSQNRDYVREATPWSEIKIGRWKFVSEITVRFSSGEKRSIKLQIMEPEEFPLRGELFLKDVYGKKFSLNVLDFGGFLVQKVPSDLPPARLWETASHILMVCLRGSGWKDRAGKVHEDPCGRDFATAEVK